jgi:hypothetical protein
MILEVEIDPIVTIFYFVNCQQDIECRLKHWEFCAADRMRFSHRINQAKKYLDPILTAEHRSKVFKRIKGVTD